MDLVTRKQSSPLNFTMHFEGILTHMHDTQLNSTQHNTTQHTAQHTAQHNTKQHKATPKRKKHFTIVSKYYNLDCKRCVM